MLPYERVCDEENLVNSSNLQSIFKVLRRVYCSSLNVGQWRRKCEVHLYLNHNCKLDLNNSDNYAKICAHANDLFLPAAV